MRERRPGLKESAKDNESVLSDIGSVDIRSEESSQESVFLYKRNSVFWKTATRTEFLRFVPLTGSIPRPTIIGGGNSGIRNLLGVPADHQALPKKRSWR